MPLSPNNQICLYGQKINGMECELWLCVVPGAVSCFGMSGLIPNSVCYLEDNYLRVVGKGELDIYEAGNPEWPYPQIEQEGGWSGRCRCYDYMLWEK